MTNKNKFHIYELIAFAAAALYFELAIIRFTAAEVLYLGYFSNFILISSFVGLGLGFLSRRKNLNLDFYIPSSLLFLFALVLTAQFDVEILKNHFGLFFFGNVKGRAGVPGAILLIILFLTVVLFFMGIGRRIAIAFSRFQSLSAYSYDITGSLIGIVLFSLHSYVASGPVVWIITGSLLLAVGFLCSQDQERKKFNLANTVLVCGCLVILVMSSSSGMITIWSSYQKLDFVKGRDSQSSMIFANGVLHQLLHPAENSEYENFRYYAVPYKVRIDNDRDIDDVLVIGSGGGTDVAVALKNGAKSVDAVEIDSRILKLGRDFHPDDPYRDARVNVHIGDGRQFLKNTDKKYDLIVFALPDSLMRLSAMTSVRLESYLFTVEAFESARRHLKDDGLFVMYNQYRWDWLVSKLSSALETVFGKPPAIFVEGPTTLFAIGEEFHGNGYPAKGFENLATDDWPFVYMKKPGIHWLYIGMIGVFLLTSIIGVYFFAPRGTLRQPDYPFFFMGMAFLLLETKSLAFFSLLFGTTWVVNSMAFAGILLSVLIANLVVQYFNIRIRKPLFGGVILCLIAAYLIPPSVFLNIDSFSLRFITGTILMFLPIFFANLVFSREFKDVDESTRAFGWNLLGAVAGGGLEYLSLLTGYRNLLWIVAACYVFAALFIYQESKHDSAVRYAK